jgi:hypothetical protein
MGLSNINEQLAYPPVLVPKPVQDQIIKEQSSKINQPENIGNTLLNNPTRKPDELNKSLFYNMYLDKNAAKNHLASIQTQTNEILDRFYDSQHLPPGNCKHLIPLRLNHNIQPRSIPIAVLIQGEIHPIFNKPPSMIIHFLPGGTIIPSVCNVQLPEMNDLAASVTTLNSMHQPRPITSLAEFFALYDEVQKYIKNIK